MKGGSRITETAYNADDRVLRVSRAVGTALAQTYATYSYTPNGLPASLADAKGNLTTYQYAPQEVPLYDTSRGAPRPRSATAAPPTPPIARRARCRPSPTTSPVPRRM